MLFWSLSYALDPGDCNVPFAICTLIFRVSDTFRGLHFQDICCVPVHVFLEASAMEKPC